MKGNCIIAQSGGPTAVINASAAGAIFEAINQKNIEKIYGSEYGIMGVLKEELFDIELESKEQLELLKYTPSSALGSCRYKLKDPKIDSSDYDRILEVFKAHNIRYFFYIGGNDSMDTVAKISKYAKDIDYNLNVIGIPKTVDNDLVGTDHCPGFGSAAKYIATSTLEAAIDSSVYDNNIVTVIETMGRNAGWLAGSAILSGINGGISPDLIYLPEMKFNFDNFGDDLNSILNKKGKAVVVVSEGIKDKDGRYIAETKAFSHDNFGHTQLGGAGYSVENFIKSNIIKRVKVVQLSILQRAATHLASKTDIDEAYMLGKKAVQTAIDGNTGYMMGLKRVSNSPYKIEIDKVDIQTVANREKMIPQEWINKEQNNLLKPFIEYVKPLVVGSADIKINNGMPIYSQLKRVHIDKKCDLWNI